MRTFAGQYPRAGYRTMMIFLARQQHVLRADRAYRFWRQAGLQVPRRRPRRIWPRRRRGIGLEFAQEQDRGTASLPVLRDDLGRVPQLGEQVRPRVPRRLVVLVERETVGVEEVLHVIGHDVEGPGRHIEISDL